MKLETEEEERERDIQFKCGFLREQFYGTITNEIDRDLFGYTRIGILILKYCVVLVILKKKCSGSLVVKIYFPDKEWRLIL